MRREYAARTEDDVIGAGQPCARCGTYNVARLMEQHGDAKLTDLLQTLADCPKARSIGIHHHVKPRTDSRCRNPD